MTVPLFSRMELTFLDNPEPKKIAIVPTIFFGLFGNWVPTLATQLPFSPNHFTHNCSQDAPRAFNNSELHINL